MAKQTKAGKGEVRVRMYRQGLGDCFLLAFNGDDGQPKYVLIDCGVLKGTKDDKAIMQSIAADIEKTTGGHIHVLVVTHEHWDHVSGFIQAQEVFDRIRFDQVWLGWPENDDDKDARELGELKAFYLNALEAAARRMRVTARPLSETLTGLLGFYGYDQNLALQGTTGDAMKYVKDPKRGEVRYCSPGNALMVPGASHVRAFVLGPPRRTELIKKSSPSSKNKETYLTDRDHYAYDEFARAAARMSGQRGNQASAVVGRADEASCPFAGSHGHGRNVHTNKFMKEHYFGPENKWRNIDEKVLEIASDLAIKLDEHTNNTCLALAFEVVPEGAVLLFPGDAQVGNWLGWEDQQYRDGSRSLGIDNLLSRTVLYKVGHHGSHNATLREKGLEKMTSAELVAMIPVDGRMAKIKDWKMPFKPLLDRLTDKSSGRILRVDDGISSIKRSGLKEKRGKSLAGRVVEKKIYLELRISGTQY